METPVIIQHAFNDPLNKLCEICSDFKVPSLEDLENILKSDDTVVDGEIALPFIFYEWNCLHKLFDVLKQLKSQGFPDDGKTIKNMFDEVKDLYNAVIETNSAKPILIKGSKIAKGTYDFNSMAEEVHEKATSLRVKIHRFYLNKTYTLIDSNKNGHLQKNINRKKITLTEFMKTCCSIGNKQNLKSKTTYLHRLNQEDKINLPTIASDYRRGQSKYYFLDDLVKLWPDYSSKFPAIPVLDHEKTQKVTLK